MFDLFSNNQYIKYWWPPIFHDMTKLQTATVSKKTFTKCILVRNKTYSCNLVKDDKTNYYKHPMFVLRPHGTGEAWAAYMQAVVCSNPGIVLIHFCKQICL